MSRIVIADDHAYLRTGLEAALTRVGHEIVASVADGAAARQAIDAYDPDVVILDIRMPVCSGIEVLEELRAAGDGRKVVLLTAALENDALLAAVRAKVDAIVMKDEAPEVLQHAIARVAAGGRAIPLEMMDRAFELASVEPPADPLAPLSTRDRHIVEAAAAGLRNRQIAAQLGLTEAAVKTYLHRIFDRLGVTNRTELALLVARMAAEQGRQA